MRFVIFNLAVLLALGYLLLANPEKWPAWLASPTPAAELAPAAEPPAPVVVVQPATELEAAPAPEPAVAVAPPPPPPPPPPAEVVREAAPTPLWRRPVAATASPMRPTPVLMTPQERRRELDRLVDDMEGLFLDKLAR